MDTLSKIADAARMLWLNLDDRERMLFVYAGGWLVFSVVVSLRRKARAELRREIVEELADAIGSPSS